MVNEQGGVAGHKINFISLDDGYSPPKTVEQVRRLVEQDQVAFLFNTLGTPTNSAIVRYVNQKKVPHLFVATGADKWGDYKHYPWTMGFQPSYRTEAQIYTKYMLQQKPDAKIAILYQNDDFGKDYSGRRQGRTGRQLRQDGDRARRMRRPTRRSTARSPRCRPPAPTCCWSRRMPKFAAQAIRKVHDLGWKPMFFMTNVSISVGAVMNPAGPENGDRHDQHRLSEGSDRSALGQRCRHERMARLHGQVHAGRRSDRRQLCRRLWPSA